MRSALDPTFHLDFVWEVSVWTVQVDLEAVGRQFGGLERAAELPERRHFARPDGLFEGQQTCWAISSLGR